ncbi:MAG: hypothetical protein DWQ42_16785 [Planctomycetota bacterium]|nr:MAG: hypothetical protein DWQ42_16785 [Planctomycetota bacterium]REK46611.1 MAG: hypothetical protein DWQ46_06990 [Planctomycetota bacterium]
MRQLADLQANLAKLEEAGIQPVGISYDAVEVLEAFAKEKQITYPLLSDPESAAIRAYGILNERAAGRQEGIPHPATFLVDQDGIVRAMLTGTVTQRPTVAQLLSATEDAEAAAAVDGGAAAEE